MDSSGKGPEDGAFYTRRIFYERSWSRDSTSPVWRRNPRRHAKYLPSIAVNSAALVITRLMNVVYWESCRATMDLWRSAESRKRSGKPKMSQTFFATLYFIVTAQAASMTARHRKWRCSHFCNGKVGHCTSHEKSLFADLTAKLNRNDADEK